MGVEVTWSTVGIDVGVSAGGIVEANVGVLAGKGVDVTTGAMVEVSTGDGVPNI